MTGVVPEGKQGIAEIRHLVISRKEEEHSHLRAVVTGSSTETVKAGTYAALYLNGRLMMSDTRYEQRSNSGVLYKAKGHVIIAGLGIGMVLVPLLLAPEVTKVTIIELNQDVIDLVAPAIRDFVGPEAAAKLEVICSDIFTWTPPKGEVYDTLYWDIWFDVCTDNLEEMSKLNRRFSRRKAPGAWMDAWEQGTLKYRRRQEQRNSYYY